MIDSPTHQIYTEFFAEDTVDIRHQWKGRFFTVFHMAAFLAPENPTPQQVEDYRSFFTVWAMSIPELYCRPTNIQASFAEIYLSTMRSTCPFRYANRKDLFEWTVDFANRLRQEKSNPLFAYGALNLAPLSYGQVWKWISTPSKQWVYPFWYVYHMAAHNAPREIATTAYLTNLYRTFFLIFGDSIPCETCRADYLNIFSKEVPYNANSQPELWQWSVDSHNCVNRKLGKPEISSERALKRLFLNPAQYRNVDYVEQASDVRSDESCDMRRFDDKSLVPNINNIHQNPPEQQKHSSADTANITPSIPSVSPLTDQDTTLSGTLVTNPNAESEIPNKLTSQQQFTNRQSNKSTNNNRMSKTKGDMDEFSERAAKKGNTLTKSILNLKFAGVVGALLVIGIIVAVFSLRRSKKRANTGLVLEAKLPV